MPLGVKASDRPAPRASANGAVTGASMPALGSSSTSTSSASPQVLPAKACRLDRPTDHAGYWEIIAWVSDTTSKSTSNHVAIANGDWTIPASRALNRVGLAVRRPSPLATKWNHAASSSTSTVSSRSAVVSDHRHFGNEFDHGTPKLDTYHQPLTLANDRANTKTTTAANRYQRGGDLGDVAVGGAALRPEDGRGGLVHRKQRNDAAQQQTRDSRDDGC